MKRKIAAILSLFILTSLLSGCWNYREVESLEIVAGVAVDKGYEGYKYHVTIDLADTSNAGKDKPVVTTLVESEGNTMFEAIRNAIRNTGYKLYWPNCQVAIIGKDVAQDSILPVIDWLMRDAEPRLTMEVFVSQEQTAKDVLKQQSATMAITSFEIDRIYELNEKNQPTAVYQVLYEIYNTLAGSGRALALPSIHLIDNMGQKTCQLNGMAVFSRDKAVGFLAPDDAKYALFAMNVVKGGTLDIKSPAGNPIASLEIFSNNTSVKPTVADGKIKFSVSMKTDVAVDELDTDMDLMKSDQIEQFKAMAEQQLRDQVARSIKVVQSNYGKDIFGFGDILHKSNPDVWYPVSQNWDSVFQTLTVDVSSEITIRNSASVRGAVEVGDSK